MNTGSIRIGVAAALLGASTGVMAESSVTLFGILDAGLNFTNNAGGGKAYQMTSVDSTTSRWGIKGNEDLGGGLHANFDLESGLNVESGALAWQNRLFGFQSTVGLQSEQYGTVTIGRQYDSIADTVGLLTANGNWAGYLFSHPLDNDNTDGTFHANNSIKYTSPTVGGLTATALYGFSNQAGGFTSDRMYSAGLNYTISNLTLSAVYEDLSSPGTQSGGGIAAGDEGFVAANQKIWGVGAGYKIGPATVNAIYTHTNVGQAVSSIYVGDLGTPNPDLKFDNIELNVYYNVTPVFNLGAMYTYTRANVNQDGSSSSLHWNQAALMAQYLLSKRTFVYSQFVYQRVSGNADDSILNYAYIPGSAGVSSNHQQMVVRVGLQHSF
ncbi:porin [Paraburkholderia sp.]|uniref:porin n=1 Tax=Paraburkholderia sp. TaxID=1926495 RepID=UPI003C7E63CA